MAGPISIFHDHYVNHYVHHYVPVAAVCPTPCHNGGTCSAPSRCSCAPGFAGSHCQDDIDECLLGEAVHRCTGDSVCVNRPGWFYCSCLRGYRSYHNPLDGSTSCIDEDECETNVATCHHSATCLNTLGSYTCYCGDRPNDQCQTGETENPRTPNFL